jgi:aryl-alcohol dehydrogenase-like predicted oxidoreductase
MNMRTDVITTQPRRGAEAIFARVRAARRRPRSRRERALELIQEHATPRTIAIAGGAVVATAVLAYAGRKLFWQAVAVAADAVEEVADTIEDAAEDLSETARARANGEKSS